MHAEGSEGTSSLTVYQGDIVNPTLVDPSTDPDTFSVLDPGFSLNVGAQAIAIGTFTASKVRSSPSPASWPSATHACKPAHRGPHPWRAKGKYGPLGVSCALLLDSE